MGKRNGGRAKSRGLAITRLLKRDGNKCWICSKPLSRSVRDENSPQYITFDHIVPLSKGGHDEWYNIRLAHQLCNRNRGNQMSAKAYDVAAETYAKGKPSDTVIELLGGGHG